MDLYDFCCDYLNWVEGGAKEKTWWRSLLRIKTAPFSRSEGLCAGLRKWNASKNQDTLRGFADMLDLFMSEGLDDAYPFGGCDVYWKERRKRKMHLNKQRIAWVEEQVRRYDR